MTVSNNLLRGAVTGALLLSATTFATNAYASDPSREQCGGVIKAGKNDCATSMNACHGHVEVDSGPMAWIYVPKGTCEKIAGAHLVKVADPTPTKS